MGEEIATGLKNESETWMKGDGEEMQERIE